MADVVAYSDKRWILRSNIHSQEAEEIVAQYQKIPNHDVEYRVDYEDWETPLYDEGDAL